MNTAAIEPGMSPGDRIKLYRRRAGLTQEQAAQLKGCTVSAWRKWESGERQVTSITFNAPIDPALFKRPSP